MADDTNTLWASIEAMPEFQEKTPQEKMGYAQYFLEKSSQKLAPQLAGNPEAQQYFREKSKRFLFKIAEDHFPSALASLPSQVSESFAREQRASIRENIDRFDESAKIAETNLAELGGVPDDQMVSSEGMRWTMKPWPAQVTAKQRREVFQQQLDTARASNPERTKRLADSFAESAKRTPSAAMLQLELSEGWAGWDEYVATNWKNETNPVSKAVDLVGSVGAAVSGLMAESSVQSGKGMVTGIAVSAATGNPIVGGATMGAVAADSEFQATYLQELQAELQNRGGDVSSKAIQDVLADPEWNARVDEKARTRGVTIGAAESVAGMLSFGIANKIGTQTAKKALLGTGIDTAISGAGGSGGEFLARLFSGDDIWTPEARKDIVSEGVAELGQGPAGVAAAFIESRKGGTEGAASPSPREESGGTPAPGPSQDAPEGPAAAVDDDGDVRSVLEELEVEEEASPPPALTPDPAPAEPAVTSSPEPIEPPAPVDDLMTDAAPAPSVEASSTLEEIAGPDRVEPVGEPSSLPPLELDDQLEVRFRQEGDRVTPEKFNRETGATIPFVGAEEGFASRADALAFVRDQFNFDEDADIVDVPDAVPIEETDQLMELLQREKMRPPQSNIAEFGRTYRRGEKGQRATERDTGRMGQYEGAPLIRDYVGNPEAQARLRGIWSNDSSNRPDQIAQMAFDNEGKAPLISAPNQDALFEAIKQRLGGNLTSEASMTEDPERMAEREFAERSNAAEKFLRSLTSPYRRGGMLDGRQLQEGDVLDIAGDTVTVGPREGENVMLHSKRYGESYPIGVDEKVGFDAMEEAGIPVSEREATSPENVVTRDDAGALTPFVQERLIAANVLPETARKARAVSSREHSALARSRKELEAARRLAKLFGRRVVGVSELGANGAISGKDPDNIYIATDSSRTEMLVVSHEILHQLRQEDPELYADLLDAFGARRDEKETLIVDADLQAYINEMRPEHFGRTSDFVVEELLADYLSERAADPAFWESLAKRDPSMFERFVDFVLGFLRELADRIARDKIEVEKYLHDQAAMREALESVVVAFAARKRQADAGILDVPLSEALPFEDDLPFADERQLPKDPFAPDERESRGYRRWITAIETGGPVNPSQEIPVGKTPAVLQATGVDPLPIVVSASVVKKATEGKHAVSFEDISRIPEALANPVAVLPSRGRIDSLVVLTEFVEPEGPVIVPIAVSQDFGSGKQVNRITSIYGKRLNNLVDLLEDGLLYAHKQKILDWQKRNRVQFPYSPAKRGNGRILNQEDVVKGVDRGEFLFSDRRTKPNQQVFGQEVGREDEVQGKAELQAAIRSNYFDSTDPVHAWSIHEAFRVLNDLEAGRINAVADTGLDAANQTLIGELWAFGQRMIRETGDDSLFTRMRGRANDYFDREATQAARGLNARGWYVRQLDQLLGDVEKGKRAAVNKGAGADANGKAQDAAAEVGSIQRDLDSIKVAIEDFTPEEKAALADFIAKNRGDVAAAQTEKVAGLLAGGKKPGARVSRLAASKRLSDYFGTSDSDMRFSDPDLSRGDRDLLIRRFLQEQLLESKKRKRGVFVRNLTELGMSEESAGARFLEAAEIRELAKRERKLDDADAKAGKADKIDENDPESVRRAIHAKAIAALDEESGRLDKLNEKARKISERLGQGPKKRQKPDPANKSELDRMVQDAIDSGDAFSREETVKAGLRIGLNQASASALADAIATEIKNRGARKAKPRTISDRAKAIAERFNNPESRSKREPDPLRKLINATLRKDSTLTEAGFMAQAKALGVSQPEAADLWQALSTERQKRAELRELLRLEREARKPTDEAGAIIKRLAASQSDTQDNRPAETREQAIRAIYQDFVSHGAYGERTGPAMSRAGFVAALLAEGVQAQEADLLAALATRERQNRLDTAHGKAAVAAVERSVPFIMREILAHPLLRSVGPEERFRIMSRIFEERAGMTPEKARAAAVQFDTQLKAKWERAAVELAERYATKRNSPFFRREGAVTIGKIFDAMAETRDVTAAREAFEQMVANGESREAISAALAEMGVARGTADRLASLAKRTERVQKTLFDKVREAVRAGALDPRRRVLDEVAKANGWVDLSETELRELSELDASLDAKDLTDFEAVSIKKRMARIVNGSELSPDTKKLIREYLLANMFSGPRTWGVQLSTFFSQGYNVLVRDLATAAVGSATGRESINLVGWTSAMRNWTHHVRNAIADGGVALLQGQVRGVQEAEIMNAISALEGVYDRNLAIWSNPRSTGRQKFAALVKVGFSSVRFFLRILGGLDGLAQGLIRAWVTDLEQFSRAAGFGMDRKQIRQMVGEIMLLRQDFEQIADEKGFRGPSKMAYVNDRIAMAMHGVLAGQGIPEDVLDAVKERSFREAAMETGVNDFETGTSFLPRYVAESAVGAVRKGPFWVTWILPVIRTAFNLFQRSAWHSPYGMVRLVNVGRKTQGFQVWQDADGKVLSPYENSLADPSQLARRSVEAIVGTALWTGLIALIGAELEKEDEDRLFRINLGGPSPSDRSRFTAWRRDGRRPFTLQFRSSRSDDWNTLGFRGGGFEVFNFPLTILGAWEQKEYSMARNRGDATAFALTLASEMAGEAFFPLRSVSSRSNMVRSDQLAGRAGYTLSSLVPGSALLRTPMKFRDYQDHEGPAAAFVSQIPVLQLAMEDTPRLNSLGDPIGAKEASWGYLGSVLGVPVGVVPAAKPWIPGTPVEDAHIYQLFGKMDYFPGNLDRASLGEDVSDATYRALVMRRGQLIKKFVREHYGQLARMEPERFKKEVREFTTKVTRRASK